MKRLFFVFLVFIGLILPSSSYASHINLEPCVEISHCVREEFEINNVSEPLIKAKDLLEKTPRTKIVSLDGDYIKAEVTSRIMKYVDDLEISFSPETNKITIRSESRVGEGDFGVNRKRVEKFKTEFNNN